MTEGRCQETGEEPVADAMTAPVGRLRLIDAQTDNHIQMLIEELVDHARRARRVVGRVAIDEHVDVGLDIREHAAHDVTLALAPFAAHDRAGLARDRRGAVGRIVVVHEDLGRGQCLAEIGDDRRDGGFLIVAGHQHGDPKRP